LDIELQPQISKLRSCRKNVQEQIALARDKAFAQELKLQEIDRQVSSKHRIRLDSFVSRSDKNSDAAKEWRLQSEERKQRKLIKNVIISFVDLQDLQDREGKNF